MALLPEIDLVHRLSRAISSGGPSTSTSPCTNGDALREAEHQIHVVLDDQDRDVLGELVEHLQDAMRFQAKARRAARRGSATSGFSPSAMAISTRRCFP